MPKFKKNKRQRRQNALKMNEILRRRKIPECEFDDKNNYSNLPIIENDNGLNTNNDDTAVNDSSQETI
ncbi:unnamed protein product [Parnassius apollo]|uniref:(apollo) hypothetical protein n=1 Tax=Parnassius apollo TaxID=110799 RepID=A0A8S3XM47_PARAO|nr:unnamed protein product [Parnassius apollo]